MHDVEKRQQIDFKKLWHMLVERWPLQNCPGDICIDFFFREKEVSKLCGCLAV